MSSSFEFVLGSVETSVVGRLLGVDVRRPPLRFRNTTTDPVRLVKLASAVTTGLAERRLVVGDELHPKVRMAFGLFAGHRLAVSVSGIDGLGQDIAMLALTDGAQALGITQRPDEDEMLFSLFSDDDLVEILAGVLPGMGAASGPEATVRQSIKTYGSAFEERKAAERAHDEEETSAFGDIQVVGKVDLSRKSSGAAESDRRRLHRVLSGERLGDGRIEVSGAGGGSSSSALGWVDTDDGRYLVHTATEGGEFVARYEPAGYAAVSRAIRDLVSQAY